MFVIFRDSVEWDTEQEEAAQQKINENSRVKLGEDQQSILPSQLYCVDVIKNYAA